MRIAAVATAFPEHYYAQDELLLALKRQWGDRLGNADILERLHRRLGVEGRHLALPVEQYHALAEWGATRPLICPVRARTRRRRESSFGSVSR